MALKGLFKQFSVSGSGGESNSVFFLAKFKCGLADEQKDTSTYWCPQSVWRSVLVFRGMEEEDSPSDTKYGDTAECRCLHSSPVTSCWSDSSEGSPWVPLQGLQALLLTGPAEIMQSRIHLTRQKEPGALSVLESALSTLGSSGCQSPIVLALLLLGVMKIGKCKLWKTQKYINLYA